MDTFVQAGEMAKQISQQGLEITIKPDKTPVTNGDLEVDKMLREKISSITPDIPIISEETVNIEKENNHKNFW